MLSATGLAWLFLSAAIIFEVAGTLMLKTADGFSRPGWFAGAMAAYCICFAFFSLALRQLPVGVAYAVWAAAGTALIVVIAHIVYREPVTAFKVVCLVMIVAGVVGLRLTTSEQA